jgi:hypothetical protein
MHRLSNSCDQLVIANKKSTNFEIRKYLRLLLIFADKDVSFVVNFLFTIGHSNILADSLRLGHRLEYWKLKLSCKC